MNLTLDPEGHFVAHVTLCGSTVDLIVVRLQCNLDIEDHGHILFPMADYAVVYISKSNPYITK